MNSKPNVRDWVLAGIGITFVVMGIIILPSNRDVGISTIAFFGVCAVVPIMRIMRKRRYGRLEKSAVDVVIGVKIRPSRVKVATFGATFFCLGIILLVFAPGDTPLLVSVCFWVIAGVGGLVLTAVVSGVFPAQSLEFRSDGLVFTNKKWSVFLPWRQIKNASAGEMYDNPILVMWFDSPADFTVSPPQNKEKFLKYVGQCRKSAGADFFLMTTHYDVDLPVLLAAINKYRVNHPSSCEMNAVHSFIR